MTEANAEIVEDLDQVEETGTETAKDDATDAKPGDGADAGKDATAAADGAPEDFVADPKKTDEENAAALAEWEKANGDKDEKGDKPTALPDDWREIASGGDEATLKALKRYGSISGVAKALVEAQKMIRSGKVQMDKPDPSDEKAMAEWRKAQGIPDDPAGYVLPDDVKKRLTDDDKPILSAFTEFAHAKGARPDVVEIGASWYIDQMEAIAEKQSEQDKIARDEAESALRKDWAHSEYKANTTLGKRFVEQIPGLGEAALGLRGPDGRMLGDNPAFIAWAAEQGRSMFGDVAFATGDSERQHTARREEIEKIRNTDFQRYESEGLDKELRSLIEKDLARGKR